MTIAIVSFVFGNSTGKGVSEGYLPRRANAAPGRMVRKRPVARSRLRILWDSARTVERGGFSPFARKASEAKIAAALSCDGNVQGSSINWASLRRRRRVNGLFAPAATTKASQNKGSSI